MSEWLHLALRWLHVIAGVFWLGQTALFTWLEDAASRSIDYWRAALGAVILLLVLAFPHGMAGSLRAWRFSR